MYYNLTKIWFNVLEKLVREHICTRSTRRWHVKLFLSLMVVACVNAELSPGQQKKYNRRCLYLISLGEEMVKPDIRKRVDSGNFDRHTRRAMRVMVVP
jgi:hypothetical protein